MGVKALGCAFALIELPASRFLDQPGWLFNMRTVVE